MSTEAVPSTVELSDGAKLRVWQLGGTNPAKPLLIAVHGAPGHSSHLEPLDGFGFLHEKYRVLIFDLRGSGASEVKGPFTDERWIQDIDELRTWAGVDTFILAGGSYGGFLSLGYALAYPQRLSALILRDTWTCGFRGSLRALANILTSERISPDPARQVRLWSGNLTGKHDSQEGIREALPIYLPSHIEMREFEGQGDAAAYEPQWQVHNAAFAHSVPRFDVRHRLGEINTRTLIVVGRQDLICPVDESEELHAGIAGSELVVFERSGHNPAADEPDAFRETVGGFLDKLYYA